MTEVKKYATDIAKEITIAQLNNAAPAPSYDETGKHIGNMYEEIFNKVYGILTNDD